MADNATMQGPHVKQLEDSAPLLDDVEELRRRWDQDGVLFFKNVLDKDSVATVRNEYVRRLKALGLIEPENAEPVWTGVDQVDGQEVEAVEDSVWRDFVTHPGFDRVVSTVIGEAPAWIPTVVYRVAPPLDSAAVPKDIFAGRHQDAFFNKGLPFTICWVPLMEIDDEVGGLAVIPGTHKTNLHNPDAPPLFPIPDGATADEDWRRCDYGPGDVLVFNSNVAHAGLPNQSDKFRLSIDVRFLPASASKPIIGHIAAFEGNTATIVDEGGERHELTVTEDTYVRGPKGARVTPDNYTEVLFEGNAVLAVHDADGKTPLIRGRSRMYLDLPQTWYSELPPSYAL